MDITLLVMNVCITVGNNALCLVAFHHYLPVGKFVLILHVCNQAGAPHFLCKDGFCISNVIITVERSLYSCNARKVYSHLWIEIRYLF